jgi:DNA-binding transcriptional MerR regulator
MQFKYVDINEQKLMKLLASNKEELSQLFEKIVERNFYIGEAEIPRKTLNDWERESLLPFPNEEKGWTKFSLVEFTWLRCISELRSFGVPIERIKKIKAFFFDTNTEIFKKLTPELIENFTGDIQEREKTVAIYKRKDIPEEIWKQVFNQMQISLFLLLLIEIIIYNHNLCFTVDKSDNIQVIAFGTASEERSQKNIGAGNQLSGSSFILINLRKIVHSFFENDKIKYDNEFIISFLKPKERKIIERIRKGGIKEITIKFDKKSEPTLIDVTDNTITEAVINKAARLLKKGQYEKIVLQTKNGKLINYENKTSEKL